MSLFNLIGKLFTEHVSAKVLKVHNAFLRDQLAACQKELVLLKEKAVALELTICGLENEKRTLELKIENYKAETEACKKANEDLKDKIRGLPDIPGVSDYDPYNH